MSPKSTEVRFKCHHYILIFLLIHLAQDTRAQIGLGYQSNPAVVGSTSLFLSPTASMGLNPASIYQNQQGWAGLVSAQRLYNTDLSNYSAAVTKNLNSSSFGLQVSSYGIDGFKRSSISGGYAMKLATGLTLGTQVNLYQLNIEGLGNQSAVNATLGVKHDVSDRFSYEVVGHNLLGNQDEKSINRYLHASVLYRVSDILSLYNSVYATSGQTISIRPGILYNAYKSLALNVAFDTANSTYAYGLKLGLADKWKLYAGLQNHLNLGSSLAVSIEYAINSDY